MTPRDLRNIYTILIIKKKSGYDEVSWRGKGIFKISEQGLMDQQSLIRKKQWLTKLEPEEIQRRMEDEPNDSKSEDEQWFLGFNEKGGDVFLKDVRVVVEEIGNRHESVEVGFRIKDKLQEDEKEMKKKKIRDLKAKQNKIAMPQKS